MAPTFWYLGQNLPLHIVRSETGPFTCQASGGVLTVTIPEQQLSPDNERAEAALSLKLWIKRETKSLLAERMDHWSAHLGVTPSRLVITSPRARWGSCTAANEIRLNWRLIQLSPDLLDYVVAHEVCHIPHKNHGAGFWKEVEGLIPDYKTRRAALRDFEKTLFAAASSR